MPILAASTIRDSVLLKDVSHFRPIYMGSIPIDADISASAFRIWMRFGLSCRGVPGLAKHERQPRGHPYYANAILRPLKFVGVGRRHSPP